MLQTCKEKIFKLKYAFSLHIIYEWAIDLYYVIIGDSVTTVQYKIEIKHDADGQRYLKPRHLFTRSETLGLGFSRSGVLRGS